MQHRRKILLSMALAVGATTLCRQATAATSSWSYPGSGSWGTAGNWTGGVPVNGSTVNITNNAGYNEIINYNVIGTGITLGPLTIDGPGIYPNTLSMSANTLTTSGQLTVGNTGAASFSETGGTVNLSSGSALELGVSSSGVGSYLLSGANAQLLESGSEYIGYSGSGSFMQNGGTNNVSNFMIVGQVAGSNGSFSLTAGTLNEGFVGSAGNDNEVVGYGGNGTFSQTGGTNNIGTTTLSQSLYIGYYNTSTNSSYTINNSGTTLQVSGSLYVGYSGTGTFNQVGGTVTLSHASNTGIFIGYNTNSIGTYNLNSTLTTDLEYVGYSGYGVFNSSSGANNTVNVNLSIGVNNGSTGVYNLTAGNNLSFSGANEYVGQAGNGTMNQSGGSNTVGSSASPASLYVGNNSSGTGLYTMSGSSPLTVYGNEIIANASKGTLSVPGGTFNQTNGTHTIYGILSIGAAVGSNGLYELSGGTLNELYSDLALDVGTSGTGAFVQTGGSHNPNGNIAIGGGGSTTGVGTYILNSNTSAASLTCGLITVGYGGTGTFTQAGQSNVSCSALVLSDPNYGGLGTYNLSGTASLTCGEDEVINGGSAFNQSGGSNSLDGTLLIIGASSYSISGAGSILNASSGITMSATAFNSANLYINGGSVIVSTSTIPYAYPERIGNGNSGLLNARIFQTGGMHTLGSISSPQNLYIGYAGGFGSYDLEGSSANLFVFGNVIVGNPGSNDNSAGYFTVDEGTATITGSISAGGSNPGYVDYVQLNGGSLSVGTLNLSTGTVFSWSGGNLTLTAINTFGTNPILGSVISVPASSTLTNTGSLNLVGATLTGSGSVINSGLMSAYGTIDIAGGFVNTGELLISGSSLTLTAADNTVSSGDIEVQAGGTLSLASASLTNSGTINLTGGLISGGNIVNLLGTVAGRGMITAAINNSAGSTVMAQGGTLTVPAFNNNGSVLVGAGATLTGGLITNNGRVGGTGTIINPITNTGTIEAVAGTLNLYGTITNPSAGIIYADTASDTIVNAFPTNTGTIELNGGVFETLNHTLSNAGTIIGYGRLRTGGLTNNGTMQLAGGSITVDGFVNNSIGATVTVQNANALFTSLITNSGTFRIITGGTATFAGGYTGGNVSNSIVNTGSFAASSALVVNGNFTNSGTANISGSQKWSTGDIFTNTAGTATFSTDAGASGQNLGMVVTGGTVTFASSQHLASLNVSTGATAVITGGGNGQRSIVYTPSLSATGTVDLTGNDLDVQSGGPAALSLVFNLVRQGFAGGTLTGAGISSSSAALDSTHLTAVGVILDTGFPNSLDGFAVGSNDVLAKYTYYGDADLSGRVDGSDYSLIDNGYLNHLTGWANGDFNYDGVVNGSDYALIDNAFNRQGVQLNGEIASATAQLAEPSNSSVPEPAGIALIAAVAASQLRRRVRRS